MRHVALAVLVACGGCDATSPEATLDGLWGARYAYVTPTDSITLALTQEDSAVRGFGILRLSDDPDRYYEVFAIGGSTAAGSIDLSLSPRTRSAPFSYHLRGTIADGQLSGTVDFKSDEAPIVLWRFRPLPGDVVGTWVLRSRSGPPPEDTRLVRDTVIVYADGRAWRSRDEETLAYATIAMWSRRGDWLVLEQLQNLFAMPHGPVFDSLRVKPDTLLRMTPATVVERFVRVSTAHADAR